jgi:energy-coupling factor transporter ATP-binding protein EcfA2
LINQLKTAPRALDDPFDAPAPVRHLAFSRPPPPSGEFTDFTARYGHLLESDKQTLMESLLELSPKPTAEQIEQTCSTMKIGHLLKLPLISLSSGQTRRARIASALLTRPHMLMLEDPLAGLDIASRKEVANLLGKVNANDIRLVLVLRGKGKGKETALPDWVTDVVNVQQGEVWIGPRSEYEAGQAALGVEAKSTAKVDAATRANMLDRRQHSEPLVEMDEVSVSYGVKNEREVSDMLATLTAGLEECVVGHQARRQVALAGREW